MSGIRATDTPRTTYASGRRGFITAVRGLFRNRFSRPESGRPIKLIMRSKKIRIVFTGSFLTVLAVVLAVRKESAAPPRSFDSPVHPFSPVKSAPAALLSAPPAKSPALASSGGGLWKYAQKPANAARVESLMAIPSHEVHYAQIDHALLSSDQSPLKQVGGQVDLTLPDGSVLPVVVQKTRSLGDDRYVTEGSVGGQNQGRAVFAYSHGELSAVVDDATHGSWQMRALGTSTSQVFKVDGTMVPPCESSIQKTIAAKVASAPTAKATAAGAPVVAGDEWSGDGGQVEAPPEAAANSWWNAEVRVLVPYSKIIETVLDTWSIQSYIDLAIAEINNNLWRSAIPVTVTLAGAPGVQYYQEWDGSGNPALTALQRVTSSTDGIMDEIHVMRTDANADLVCFAMCAIDGGNSGVGYILNAPGDAFNPTLGFSVVNFWYMSSNSTFSHEIGHNLGCSHDHEHSYAVDGSSAGAIYPYSYGYRFYGNDGQQYRTIMAYPPGNVLPFFSNPYIGAWSPIDVAVGSQPGQWDQAYNALTITQNAWEVASYRYSRLTQRITRRIRGW